MSFANSVWYSGYSRNTSTKPLMCIHFRSQYVNALTSLLLFTITSWLVFAPAPLCPCCKCTEISQPTKSPFPVCGVWEMMTCVHYFMTWNERKNVFIFNNNWLQWWITQKHRENVCKMRNFWYESDKFHSRPSRASMAQTTQVSVDLHFLTITRPK